MLAFSQQSYGIAIREDAAETLHLVDDQDRTGATFAHEPASAADSLICSKNDRLLIPDDVCQRSVCHGERHFLTDRPGRQ